MVPEFIRFYSGYTITTVMDEYAKVFFALVNAMYRLQADEQLREIEVESSINGSDESFSNIKKKSRGLHGILQEVRTIKK